MPGQGVRVKRSNKSLEVIDAQVHANRILPNWSEASPGAAVEAAVAAMNAVGVDALLHDEYAGVDSEDHILPGVLGPSVAWRSESPFGEEAIRRYPERFAYITRVDERDPDLEALVSSVRRAPGRLALRVIKVSPTDLVQDVENGRFDRLFAAAETSAVPVFMTISLKPEALEPHLTRHPDLQLILDHCGVAFPRDDVESADRYRGIDRLLALARHPNLAIKWCHIERLAADRYPFNDAVPQLRRVVDAFGAHRIMWGSDWTESIDPLRSSRPCNWSQALRYLSDSQAFDAEEKRWMLGKTIRSILRWN
jgi:predicted TIM-barrel fold metal-dependent hydrolase